MRKFIEVTVLKPNIEKPVTKVKTLINADQIVHVQDVSLVPESKCLLVLTTKNYLDIEESYGEVVRLIEKAVAV